MQQKLINNISVSARILILFLLIGTLLVANSLFLIMFITVLTAIVVILVDKNVKLYVVALKKSLFWLLFLFIIYIMIFRDILGLIVFAYKMLLIIILVVSFMLSVSFDMLADGIYTIISPVLKFVGSLDKKAYSIARYIYFYSILLQNGNKIKKSQQIKNSMRINVKYYLLPRMIVAADKITELENSLKLNFYKVKKEKINFVSFLLVFCFVVLFIVAVFKEVIL